ncbi:MAG: DUF4124 domain-containing protein [Rhodocyclales bacterium]|nr:DUF4124 domain-containing protein [Rhodocyclales bacterium]
MRILTLLALASILAIGTGSAVAGKVYHWKDEQGRSHYSDKPPPEATLSVEEKRVFSGTPDAAQPFSVRKVAQEFPVVFYSAHECAELCVEARALRHDGRQTPLARLRRRRLEHPARQRRLPAATPPQAVATARSRCYRALDNPCDPG